VPVLRGACRNLPGAGRDRQLRPGLRGLLQPLAGPCVRVGRGPRCRRRARRRIGVSRHPGGMHARLESSPAPLRAVLVGRPQLRDARTFAARSARRSRLARHRLAVFLSGGVDHAAAAARGGAFRARRATGRRSSDLGGDASLGGGLRLRGRLAPGPAFGTFHTFARSGLGRRPRGCRFFIAPPPSWLSRSEALSRTVEICALNASRSNHPSAFACTVPTIRPSCSAKASTLFFDRVRRRSGGSARPTRRRAVVILLRHALSNRSRMTTARRRVGRAEPPDRRRTRSKTGCWPLPSSSDGSSALCRRRLKDGWIAMR